jgi:hypothetical protein
MFRRERFGSRRQDRPMMPESMWMSTLSPEAQRRNGRGPQVSPDRGASTNKLGTVDSQHTPKCGARGVDVEYMLARIEVAFEVDQRISIR